MIRNVVLQILSSNHKNRLLAESSLVSAGPEASQGPLGSQGEAELAYLTHEGLFISDALSEAQQQESATAGQDQRSAAGSRFQQNRTEPAAESDSSMGFTETSAGREHSFMYVSVYLGRSVSLDAQTEVTFKLLVTEL